MKTLPKTYVLFAAICVISSVWADKYIKPEQCKGDGQEYCWLQFPEFGITFTGCMTESSIKCNKESVMPLATLFVLKGESSFSDETPENYVGPYPAKFHFEAPQLFDGCGTCQGPKMHLCQYISLDLKENLTLCLPEQCGDLKVDQELLQGEFVFTSPVECPSPKKHHGKLQKKEHVIPRGSHAETDHPQIQKKKYVIPKGSHEESKHHTKTSYHAKPQSHANSVNPQTTYTNTESKNRHLQGGENEGEDEGEDEGKDKKADGTIIAVSLGGGVAALCAVGGLTYWGVKKYRSKTVDSDVKPDEDLENDEGDDGAAVIQLHYV